MKTFIFESYEFIPERLAAKFTYSFNRKDYFTEEVAFAEIADGYDRAALDRALFLTFILLGASYYKLFPGSAIEWGAHRIDAWQSSFLNKVYQEGLGQFAFENSLGREELAHFEAVTKEQQSPVNYDGDGVLSMQSGGKDSLLSAEILQRKNILFDSFYISSSDAYPEILDSVGERLHVARRSLDLPALKAGLAAGGRNGHVPVTYMVLSLALIQAILLNKGTVLASIGHEGEEAHEWVGDLPINHQWSKTWQAELLFADYVRRYVSPDLRVGSPLRQYSELRIAELFVELAWEKYGHDFSSCNLANYQQGADNTKLRWCGECPKCANFYLLFSPFLESSELQVIFNGQDLYEKNSLQDTFRGLLGVGNVMKPFECVGEVDELRLAYHKAQARGGYGKLGFDVPVSSYDYRQAFPAQEWTQSYE